MNKSRDNGTKKILIIILALMISSFIGYRFALAQSGNTLKSVVEPGSMTTEASYIIFTDGTNVYARNGTTGEIEFQSTNASYVIQSAIDALSNGGEIFIKNGNYSSNSWEVSVLNNYIHIVLEKNAVLKLDPGLHKGWVFAVKASHFEFEGGEINGDGATLDRGIYVSGASVKDVKVHNTRFKNLAISGFQVEAYNVNISQVEAASCIFDTIGDKGINVESTGNGTLKEVFIHDNYATNCTTSGIATGRFEDGTFSGNIANDNIGHGISFDSGASNFTVSKNVAEGNGQAGIVVGNSCSFMTITSNTCVDNGWYGIDVDTTQNGSSHYPTHFIIDGNICLNSRTYSGIQVQLSDYGIITNNICNGNHDYGIMLNGNYITVHDNEVLNNSGVVPIGIGATIDNSTLDIIYNRGYVTENGGTTTVSNNEWVAHGLTSTPSTVTVTSMNATYSNQPVIVSWTNSNSTHFQVGVYWANGTAITNSVISVSWHAEV